MPLYCYENSFVLSVPLKRLKSPLEKRTPRTPGLSWRNTALSASILSPQNPELKMDRQEPSAEGLCHGAPSALNTSERC